MRCAILLGVFAAVRLLARIILICIALTPQVGRLVATGDYWSGYIDESSGFNYVSGDWDVPCYSGTNNSQRALEWVGLGGFNGTNLWQAGTESDHAEGYRFWWEYLPGANIIYAGPSVSCNQAVNVEVDYNYSVG